MYRAPLVTGTAARCPALRIRDRRRAAGGSVPAHPPVPGARDPPDGVTWGNRPEIRAWKDAESGPS